MAAGRGGLQHRTPGVGLTPGTVPCCPGMDPPHGPGNRADQVWALWDLDGKTIGRYDSIHWQLTFVCYVLPRALHQMFCCSLKNFLTRTAKKASATFPLPPFYTDWQIKAQSTVKCLVQDLESVNDEAGLGDSS